MEDNLRSIALRVHELREILQIPAEEMAALCDISTQEYAALEAGEQDFTISTLQTIARRCGVELSVLMFGEEPKMSTYFLTRNGAGVSVERRAAYKYQSLTAGFSGRKAEAFIVTVEPKPEQEALHYNHHEGQEFNYVLEGEVELTVGGHTLVLGAGDSLYFDATLPHAMRALNNNRVQFIAVIL